MLKTEQNTKVMEIRIQRAAHKLLKRGILMTWFEHGQWWVEHVPTGAQWSVMDAEGLDTCDGFGFEQITIGVKD